MADPLRCIEKIIAGELPDEETVRSIADKVKEALYFEPNVVPVSSPVTVVSNLHGQLPDVLELFRVCGACPDTNYLVLGDMGDYGPWSVETVLLLFCLRLRYPTRVTLLRGEHESRAMTALYGLHLESMRKYGSAAVWEALTDAFDFLPLAALVDDRVFAVHGGVSPDALPIDRVRVMDRFTEAPERGPVADMLWSDPQEAAGVRPSPRGSGNLFGPDITKVFCAMNKVERVVRGHQMCMQGCKKMFGGLLVSVWSSPNFLGRVGNAASALEISDSWSLMLARSSRPAAPVMSPTQAGPSPLAAAEDGFFFNTFLACPQSHCKMVMEPSPFLEVPHGIPAYFV